MTESKNDETKGLYSWQFWTYNQHGGLYVLTPSDIDVVDGLEVEFSELDGKHSYPIVTIDKADFELITEDPAVISVIEPFIDRCIDVDPWGQLLDEEVLEYGPDGKLRLVDNDE